LGINRKIINKITENENINQSMKQFILSILNHESDSGSHYKEKYKKYLKTYNKEGEKFED